MEVIPAIDLRGGRVVRLAQGDYARETVYEPDPATAAGLFLAQGARRFHVVDLDGARSGDGGLPNQAGVRAILDAAGEVPVQLGGGIRSPDQIAAALALGVDRVIIGTAALESPEMILQAAADNPGRIVLGLDVREGRVAIRGWLESGDLGVEEVLARFDGARLGAVLYTDISRDGMLEGPNVAAAEQLAGLTQLPLIAAGGVGSTAHLVALARTRVIAGAVVGKALYSGAVQLDAALAEVARC